MNELMRAVQDSLKSTGHMEMPSKVEALQTTCANFINESRYGFKNSPIMNHCIHLDCHIWITERQVALLVLCTKNRAVLWLVLS